MRLNVKGEYDFIRAMEKDARKKLNPSANAILSDFDLLQASGIAPSLNVY